MDRVKETSTTTGTGTYDLAGAVSGFRTFVAGVGNGIACHYVAEMGADWEVGLGTVTDASPDTLSRTRIYASSNAGAAVSWGAGTKTIFAASLWNGIRDVTAPKGHIYGLTLSNNGTDATNDIDVAAGEATSEARDALMVLTSAITKQIDAAWAVGTGAGGMNTGSVANDTWYEVHLIRRPDTGVVDVMFTTEANRATLPTNYTQQRRIGWIRRGTATNRAFTQVDDYFTLSTPLNDVAATVTTTATAVTLTVPPRSIARFRASATTNASINAGEAIVFKEIAEDTTAPDDATGVASLGLSDIVGAAAGHFELRVDGSSQIEHDTSAATGSPTFDISTYGWIDHRRRFSAT